MELTRRAHTTACTYTCQYPARDRKYKSEVAGTSLEAAAFRARDNDPNEVARASYFRLRLPLSPGSGIVPHTSPGTDPRDLHLSAPG